MSLCPLCDILLLGEVVSFRGPDNLVYNCPNCGRYALDALFAVDIAECRRTNPLAAPSISHTIRLMQRDGGTPVVLDEAKWEQWLAQTPFPSPMEQVDNMLELASLRTIAFGKLLGISNQNDLAMIGVVDATNLNAVVQYAIEEGLLSGKTNSAGATVSLTMRGWARVEELRRAGPRHARLAFMAMRFGQPDLDRAFKECFQPAARAAGFTLQRLDAQTPAGSIDNRLRVEILRSRFVVADLTMDNAGVYWEAGFADGLGKPVLYTCRRDHFDDPGTHFDTNHHHTVCWDAADLPDAQRRLTDTIRATLPAEAVLEDETD